MIDRKNFATIRKIIRKLLFPIIRVMNIVYSVLIGYWQTKNVVILNYHRIGYMPGERRTPYYNVSPEKFERQLKFLQNKRFNVVSIEELLNGKYDENKINVCITFDDGYENNYMHAFQIIKKYKYKCSINIVYDSLGREMVWLERDTRSMDNITTHPENWRGLSEKQIFEMRKYGINFYSHSKSHTRLIKQTDIDLIAQEETVDEFFRKSALNKNNNIFAIPYGTGENYREEQLKLLNDVFCYKYFITANVGRHGIDDFKSSASIVKLRRIPIYEQDNLLDFIVKLYGGFDWYFFFQRR